MIVYSFSSAVLSALLAQAGPTESATVPTDNNDLAKQFDSILTAPTPPSQSRKSQGPSGSGLMNPDISVIFDGVAGGAPPPAAASAAAARGRSAPARGGP